MNPKSLQAFCRTLPGVTEDVKWGHDLMFSVGGKMFAGFDASGGPGCDIKCTDIEFERLTKRRGGGIVPAPYAARFSWVNVERNDALSQAEAKRFIKTSYDLVLSALPKKKREAVLGATIAGASRVKAKLGKTGARVNAKPHPHG